MKKLIILFLLLTSFIVKAQEPKVEGVGFDEATTTSKQKMVTKDTTRKWMVFDVVNNRFEYWNGTNWVSFADSSFDETADYTPSGFWNFTGNMQSTGNVDFLGTFEWHNNSFKATMPNLTQNDTIATRSDIIAATNLQAVTDQGNQTTNFIEITDETGYFKVTDNFLTWAQLETGKLRFNTASAGGHYTEYKPGSTFYNGNGTTLEVGSNLIVGQGNFIQWYPLANGYLAASVNGVKPGFDGNITIPTGVDESLTYAWTGEHSHTQNINVNNGNSNNNIGAGGIEIRSLTGDDKITYNQTGIEVDNTSNTTTTTIEFESTTKDEIFTIPNETGIAATRAYVDANTYNQNLDEVLTQGATSANKNVSLTGNSSLLINNNVFDYLFDDGFTVANSDATTFTEMRDNLFGFYNSTFIANLKVPTLTKDFDVTIPIPPTASDTLALRSDLVGLGGSSLLTPINATNNRTFLADDHEGMKVFRNIGNGEVNLSIPLDATLDYPDNSFFVFKTPFVADITKVSFPQFDGTSTVTKTVQSLGTKDGESFNVVKIGSDNWYAEGDFKYFDPIDLSSLYINMTPSSIDATATAEDDAIATWTDLQNSYNATSATNQPQVNIVNGERHVEFVSANTDFLAIPHANTNFIPGTDEFTILIKIGANYTTQDQYLYGKSLINTSTIQYGLWILNNDFRIYIGGTNLGYASADVAAGDILTLVVRNNGADFYKNDTLIYDNVGIGTATNTEDLIIGASYQGASNNADASFTDFKVWNEALTSAQVLDIVNTLN